MFKASSRSSACRVFGIVFMFTGATQSRADEEDTNTRERQIEVQTAVAAPLAEAWKAWTTTEGVKSFFAPGGNVELKVGGAFEIYFNPSGEPGSRGSDGCHVLSFLPEKMFSFEWNAPPSIPTIRNSGVKTRVVLQFESLTPFRTRVSLTQLGFGEGEDWDKYVSYFENAWAKVMGWFADRYGRPETVPRPDKAPLVETWNDGAVAVIATYGPEKRQDFETLIPASVEEVWLALTTPEGVKRFYPTDATIEMEPGGAWDLHKGAGNKVMAFVPLEMLAITGSAPPQFPEVRKGGTWGVFTFEPLAERLTRLRLSSLGWRGGEKEWDEAFEYFLVNNPIFLNMLQASFASSIPDAPTSQSRVRAGVATQTGKEPAASTTK